MGLAVSDHLELEQYWRQRELLTKFQPELENRRDTAYWFKDDYTVLMIGDKSYALTPALPPPPPGAPPPPPQQPSPQRRQ